MLKICIYIGINAHVTPADRHTDTHGKVEQYSAEAESAIEKYELYFAILVGLLTSFVLLTLVC